MNGGLGWLVVGPFCSLLDTVIRSSGAYGGSCFHSSRFYKTWRRSCPVCIVDMYVYIKNI